MLQIILAALVVLGAPECLRTAYRRRLHRYVDFDMENGEVPVSKVKEFGQRDLTDPAQYGVDI